MHRPPERQQQIIDFLTRHQWTEFDWHEIPADCSNRRYARITRKAEINSSAANLSGEDIAPFVNQSYESLILMDSQHDDVTPFITLANHLKQIGLHSPAVYAQDIAQGIVLLEDFGSISVTRFLENNDDIEREIGVYRTAIDALIRLQTNSFERHEHLKTLNIPYYSKALLQKELKIFSDFCLPSLPEKISKEQAEHFNTLWEPLLESTLLPAEQSVLVHRDYHADNLMLIDGQYDTLSALGILDFQDAVIGHPAYDLLSLLEDARRSVVHNDHDWSYIDQLLEHYLSIIALPISKEKFLQDYAILAASRNIKILGVFTRQAYIYGRREYLRYIPHVLRCLQHDLEHPSLQNIKQWINDHSPSFFSILDDAQNATSSSRKASV